MMPARVHFFDGPRSEAVEAKIEARADRLARFSDEIQKCEVWLESPHGHNRKGRLYGIRIRLTVPGEEITIERQPETDDTSTSLSAKPSTLHDARSKTTSDGTAAS